MTVDIDTEEITLQEMLRNDPIVAQYHQTGAIEKAHIVKPPDALKGLTTPQAFVMEAIVEGWEIEALCGYLWIPGKDPKKYPVCEICKDIYEAMLAKGEEGLPDS